MRLASVFHDEGGGFMNMLPNTGTASTITLNASKAHAEILLMEAE